ncbi:MAG: DUF3298 domain-containing protein [Sphingobacterium sp.]|uniref:DUF3298 and DUF4163 domain-containing protein n=1 Tax=Sphingobacterium sp. JB170 TaxID=1434842 RepID=UPI00097F191D|nr:RsiV family protein [Sphingobacterium sp. JB170]SJN37510.1 hypothetical protein FM107_09385 [Sphingobacterium sp. JB170]
MKYSLKYCFLFVFLFNLQSCNSTKKQDAEASTEKIPSETESFKDTLVYHTEQYKEFSPYFSKNDGDFDSTTYTAVYPVFSSEIDSLFKPAIFVDGESTAAQVAASFLGGFNEYAEDSMDAGNNSFHTWFMDQQCHVIMNIPGFVTLKNNISTYSGGAHGIELNLWFNYELAERKLLAITDIVNDTTRLKEIVEIHFRKHEKLSDNETYEQKYFFDNGQFVLADNFGLTTKGLVFHYNPYEIKSYAEGPTTITVPYAEISGILTPTGNTVLKNIAQK